MGRYDDKNVVITGGSSGLGLAAAQLLADGGARVLITGRDQAKLDAARERLGANAVAVRSDAAALLEIDALADRAKGELGSVDALIANAGISGAAPFEATSEEMLDQLLTVNTKGPFFTVQRFVPLLADGGSVVLTTSVVNVVGLPTLSAYAASKAALRSMTRSLARELLPRGIRVNAVSPGPIDVGMAPGMTVEEHEQMKRQYEAAVPMGRLGEPAEIARAMAFLAFDATFTTGAELAVDGGATQI